MAAIIIFIIYSKHLVACSDDFPWNNIQPWEKIQFISQESQKIWFHPFVAIMPSMLRGRCFHILVATNSGIPVSMEKEKCSLHAIKCSVIGHRKRKEGNEKM